VGALEAILAKALAKAPARRYATAAELARDLESLLEGRAVTAGEGFFLPLQRWIRPAVWVAVACLVVAGVWLARSQPWRSNIPTRHRAGLPTMQNSIGMKMMLVPPGWFMMGSASRYPSPLWADDEHIHEVRLTQPFWVSDCEVTVEQYEQVMGTLAEGMAGADRHLPVTHVTWDEANAFCEELSKREGRKYRLPTEAQWEYACRAGSMEPFAGNGDANSMGWTKVTPGGGGRLHTGGLRGDNDWGLHDFHGNAAEWCLDVYVKDYLEFSQNPVLTGSAGPHVIRGGSYLKNPLDCRSSARDQALPNARREDLGFRVVQVKDETK
jgi:formylglycine-generating enzyme required for sulfatase activity